MLAKHRKYFWGITSVSDYYPFGSPLYGRRWSAGYRFGFNSKENDNEVMGNGNFQDYGARMYDTRLGRFISADPIIINEHKYTFYSPYQFAGNRPIVAIDLDGLEPVDIGKKNPIIQQLVFKTTNKKELIDRISSLYYRDYENPGKPHKATFDIGLRDIDPIPIYSINKGTVFATGTSPSYGNYVVTEHNTDAGTFYVLYAHLSQVSVELGQAIKEGEMLGKTGDTGKGVTANKDKKLSHHLHLEVMYLPINQEKPKDYSDLIKKRNEGKIKRFNAISLEEVKSDEQGKEWMEKGKKYSNEWTNWNTGDIPINKLLDNNKIK